MDYLSEVKVKTWICPSCSYTQEFDPYTEFMQRVFSEPRYASRSLGACPACHAGETDTGVKQTIQMEEVSGTDLANLSGMRSASDDTLAATRVAEKDDDGNTIMEQVDEKYEIRINQQTGEIYTELVPILAPKQRERTTKEVSDLKKQRDQDLDKLEAIAVKER